MSSVTSGNGRVIDIAIRIGIVVLTLTTAAIHLSLGGLLFTMNAVGYAALAVAMVAPLALAERVRWLTRFALLGFTLATIIGWVLIGPRFPLAYTTKFIEVGLVALLIVEILRAHGGPVGVLRQLATLIPARFRWFAPSA